MSNAKVISIANQKGGVGKTRLSSPKIKTTKKNAKESQKIINKNIKATQKITQISKKVANTTAKTIKNTFLKNFFKNVFSSLIILHHTSLRILLFRRCKALSVDFSSLPSTLAIWV